MALFFCAFAIGCNSMKQTPKHLINYSTLKATLAQDNGMIISCNRCGCIDRFLDTYTLNISLNIYVDSNCSNLNRHSGKFYHQLSQGKLDSIYQENYNAIFYKNLFDSIKFEIIQVPTGTYKDIKKLADNFFNEKKI